MGYYVVADINNIGTSSAIKESNSEYIAPAGCVLVGRMHEKDENGNTVYKYAPLVADPNSGVKLNYTLANQVWSAGIKQSQLTYNAPDGYAIIGRKHSGDENGATSFLIAQVLVDGKSIVSSTDPVTSGNIKESSGTWWVANAMGTLMQVWTGTTHQGDENGNTTYTGRLLYSKA